MRVINVLEINNGIPLNIESFPVWEEQVSELVVRDAEEFFQSKIKEKLNLLNTLEYEKELEQEIEESLEEGSWSNRNGYDIYIIWSYLN